MFLRTARRIAIVRAIREPKVALSARSELKTFSSFLVLKAMSKDSALCRYLKGNDYLNCTSMQMAVQSRMNLLLVRRMGEAARADSRADHNARPAGCVIEPMRLLPSVKG
ncbi:MAG: hypothetical protein OXU81_01015 [Gammaproteobacteria bacterium]|nr:hypothetical protein [Gammaproteobacteria bacterium]